MYASRTRKGQCLGLIVAGFLMLSSVSLLSQSKKTSSSPPRSAAPARPAAAPTRPSGGSNAYHGSSAGGSGHPTAYSTQGHSGARANGPTANGPSATHTGPTTSDLRGRSAGDAHLAPASLSARNMPKGTQQARLKDGSTLQKRPDGRVSDVHDAQRGMDVHHNLNGSTRVSVERRDGSRVVAERGRPGYVERGFRYNGHDYARRSYYYHGREYTRYYRGYYYGHAYLHVYAPGYYYAPGFYGWAYNPWYQAVYYPWGWAGSPWYGYYGYYFTPYPVYPSASLWLTDYMISTGLQASYQAQQENQGQGTGPQTADGAAPLTPEVKQMIADEVRNQLALENAEAQQNAQNQEPDPASSGIARLLSDGQPHVFVAGGSLDVMDASGMECEISDSDALELATPPPPGATSANLVVLSSKGGKECPRKDTVTVAVTDLQDMQNHMRETIDQGLQELQTQQGTNGVPALPPSASPPPVEVAMAKDAPPPDPNGAAVINQQLADSNQAEKEVVGQVQQEPEATSTAPAISTAPPVNIALGQSVDQVTDNLGAPLTVVDLGSKKIYKYKDMKITFKDGKVSDVQ